MAEAVQSTTSTYVSLRNCVAGQTVCDSIDRAHARAIGGSPGGQDAQASQSDPEFGEAHASARLTGQPGAATLSGHARSLAARRNASSGFALQRYTNESESAQTLQVEGSLTWEQTVPEENADFPDNNVAHSGANVEMALFAMDAESVEAGTSAEDNWGILDGEPPAGYEELATAGTDGPHSNATEDGHKTFTMTTVLEPGTSVWIFVLLQTLTANGAEVKAELVTSLAIASD
jgi:hypothetical protein